MHLHAAERFQQARLAGQAPCQLTFGASTAHSAPMLCALIAATYLSTVRCSCSSLWRHVGASAQRSAPGLPGAAAAAAAVAAAPASGAAAGRLDTIQQVPGLAMPQQCGHGPTSSLAGRAEAGGGSGGVAAGGRSPNGCRRVITWKTAAAAVGRAATRCTPPYRALQKRAAPHPAEPARSQRCRLPEPYRRSSNN